MHWQSQAVVDKSRNSVNVSGVVCIGLSWVGRITSVVDSQFLFVFKVSNFDDSWKLVSAVLVLIGSGNTYPE